MRTPDFITQGTPRQSPIEQSERIECGRRGESGGAKRPIALAPAAVRYCPTYPAGTVTLAFMAEAFVDTT
jgi:hypothetical protein